MSLPLQWGKITATEEKKDLEKIVNAMVFTNAYPKPLTLFSILCHVYTFHSAGGKLKIQVSYRVTIECD
jgi:hypothetical protein